MPVAPNVDSLTVYTVGHGTGSFGDLESRMAEHSITTLVDVRSQPYSRHAPDFNRETLDGFCRVAGIGYAWMGNHLGGRPTHPALLTADGHPNWDAVRRSPGYLAGIEEVLILAGAGRVALLCAESDPSFCHRSTALAPSIEERSARVVHILSDGTSTPNQPHLGL